MCAEQVQFTYRALLPKCTYIVLTPWHHMQYFVAHMLHLLIKAVDVSMHACICIIMCVFVYGYIMFVHNYRLISIVLLTVQVESTPQKQLFASPPSDITWRRDEKPVQPNPVTFLYPSKRMGQQDRSFNLKWFSTYSWLEYSTNRDTAFCFPYVATSVQKVVRIKMCSQTMALVTGSMLLVKMVF